jgi:streptomycin 6-kinase
LSPAATARELLAKPSEVVVLHGDIHRGNVLDFGPRGWLASDPKGLVGER